MKIQIKNIGSIKKSELELGDITIIAGENDTGKSTFGKVLYSVIKSYNAYNESKNKNGNKTLMTNFRDVVDRSKPISIKASASERNEFHRRILTLQQAIIFNNDVALEVKNLSDFIDIYTHNYGNDEASNNEIKMLKESVMKVFHNYLKTKLESIDGDKVYKRAHEILKSEFSGKIVSSGESTASIIIGFANELDEKKNFSMNFNDFKLEGGTFTFGDRFKIEDVTFIDSPAVLQYYQLLSSYPSDKMAVFDIPHHVVDVLTKMKTSKINKKEDDLLKVINDYDGEMVINEDLTRFFFSKNNNLIPSNNVASGVRSISIMEMIYNGGNINDKSITIIDEPETNLHPKWQVEYAKCICKLANKGYRFLITTHSPFMIEAFKVYSSKERLVNFFYSSRDEDDCVVYKNMHGDIYPILELLSKPFEDIMTDSGNYDF